MNILKELLLTFSNQKSFFSSKRLERFFVFVSMLSATLYFVIKGVYHSELGASDLMLIVAGWLGFAGFNTVMIAKDVKADKSASDQAPQEG